ncbi:DUF6238 family protein [Streptomyces phyllanthi]|uniref:Uncharacterized protein n=1 Tax=Streptomyces phyllanthi TaxID=1803180 RepID=A0A5N8WI95_9ACTN|nr:DUF6238 family protein [Streptomyces phyllanthi]MPY46238.1 hypothetical protein [Streptomyces phyllanthi]
MPPSTPTTGPLAYLGAATASIRRQTRRPALANRPYFDAVHAHLVALHFLLDRLTEDGDPSNPATGSHLTAARTRIWQATSHLHDAYHSAPHLDGTPAMRGDCLSEQVLEGPLFLTICQRHLVTTITVRRQTTPADLASPPLHGHTTYFNI